MRVNVTNACGYCECYNSTLNSEFNDKDDGLMSSVLNMSLSC